MADDYRAMVRVNQDAPRAAGEGNYIDLKGTKRGEACVIDWYTAMVLEGRAFQIRAGSISVPIVGDVAITSTDCEYCVDAGQGLAVIPVYNCLAINLADSTLYEYAIKTVDTASNTGTAFVPLPLLCETNATAAVATGRVDGAGTVQVTAEAVTTTRALWHAANPVIGGAGHEQTTFQYEPRMPHLIANDACCYVQVAATGTGPSYFGNLDFIELSWASIS